MAAGVIFLRRVAVASWGYTAVAGARTMATSLRVDAGAERSVGGFSFEENQNYREKAPPRR